MIEQLIEIILLLVIIWLVASIRQSVLNTPGPVATTKRLIRRAIGDTGNVQTSRKNQPVDTNLVSLDTINVEDALTAVNKYFDGDQR